MPKIDLTKFSPVAGKQPKGKPYISFPSKSNITLNACCAHYFGDNGVDRVSILLSDDKKTVLALPNPDGCKIKASSNSSFSSAYLSELIEARFGKESVRFLGEFDDDLKAIIFPLENPVFY